MQSASLLGGEFCGGALTQQQPRGYNCVFMTTISNGRGGVMMCAAFPN